MSFVQGVTRASTFARLAAAVMLASVGLRFGLYSVTQAVAAQDARLPGASEPGKTKKSPGILLPLPTPAPSVKDRKTFVKGESARVTVTVTSGAPRSDVFINGVRRGKSPFLGDVSCKVGEPIKIEVVPPKGSGGERQVFERRCVPGNVRVSDW